MKIKYLLCVILGSALLLMFMERGEGRAKSDGRVYGVYERVFLPEISPSTVKAKLDTGAITTSLGAADIELFLKNGEEWVRFTPQIEGAQEMERPLVRHSNIKLRVAETAEALRSKRPVVMLDICFDGRTYTTEVNLTDRSRFNYPLLIGRASLIEFKAMVDPSQKYLSTPGCSQ